LAVSPDGLTLLRRQATELGTNLTVLAGLRRTRSREYTSAKEIQIMKSLLLLVALGALFGQTPGFEVASVKPSDPATAMSIRRSGYRMAFTSTSLEFLITWAYDVHTERLYGKPNWLDSVRYDVMANAPQDDKPAPPRQPGQPTELQKMMQSLLAERFKLVVHRETRELPMYALMVAKGGAKVRLTEAPAVMGQTPFSMPGRGRLIGTQVSAEMLAKVLSDQLGRSVKDQTGLQGVFDFKLDWEPDPSPAHMGGVPTPVELSAGSSLFTAIQEQLGLKMEARKGPVEVLVIDHIESAPTAN
jgi:bla regulator protein blaR1